MPSLLLTEDRFYDLMQARLPCSCYLCEILKKIPGTWYCNHCTELQFGCGNHFFPDAGHRPTAAADAPAVRVCDLCASNFVRIPSRSNFTALQCVRSGIIPMGVLDDYLSPEEIGTVEPYWISCYNEFEGQGSTFYVQKVSGRVLRDYSFKPRPVFMPKYDRRNIYYGVEIEAEGAHVGGRVTDNDLEAFRNHSQWYCKTDGSLINGAEMVSHPATWDFWLNGMDLTWTQKLVDRGFLSYKTTTCGMHVHVGRNALSRLDIFKLLMFFQKNKQLMSNVSRRRPQQLNRYATLDIGGKSECVSKARSDTTNRYEAINLCNPGTVEFRLFRGTLSPVAILRNIGIIHSLILFAKANTMNRMSVGGWESWLKGEGKRVLGKLFSREIYDFCMEGKEGVPCV